MLGSGGDTDVVLAVGLLSVVDDLIQGLVIRLMTSELAPSLLGVSLMTDLVLPLPLATGSRRAILSGLALGAQSCCCCLSVARERGTKPQTRGNAPLNN